VSATLPGERLKEALLAMGLKQADLARAYGCKPQYISDIVNGRGRISEKLAVWLYSEYRVNLNWLFTGKGPVFVGAKGPDSVAEATTPYDGMTDERIIAELVRRLRDRDGTAGDGPADKS